MSAEPQSVGGVSVEKNAHILSGAIGHFKRYCSGGEECRVHDDAEAALAALVSVAEDAQAAKALCRSRKIDNERLHAERGELRTALQEALNLLRRAQDLADKFGLGDLSLERAQLIDDIRAVLVEKEPRP